MKLSSIALYLLISVCAVPLRAGTVTIGQPNAPAAQTGDPMADVDRLIQGADRMLADAEKNSGDAGVKTKVVTGRPTGCDDGFSLDQLIADASAGKLGADGAKRLGANNDLLRYYAFKAFAARRPQACDPLKPLSYAGQKNAPVPGDAWCRTQYYELAYVHDLIANDPRYPQSCAASLSDQDPSIRPNEAQEVCGLIKANRADPRALCKSFIPKYEKAEKLDKCVCTFSALAGQKGVCGMNKDGRANDEEHFLVYADYPGAFAAKDASRCGASPVCKTLMGQDQTASSQKVVAAEFCRKNQQPNAPDILLGPVRAAGVTINGMLDQAEARLTVMNSGLEKNGMNPAEIDSRMEKIGRLRERLNKASNSPQQAPPKAGAKPPARGPVKK
jgi:hypothetical protein